MGCEEDDKRAFDDGKTEETVQMCRSNVVDAGQPIRFEEEEKEVTIVEVRRVKRENEGCGEGRTYG